MRVSRKTQYAIRSVFELAKRHGDDSVRIGQIAKAQAIPQRFLEGILSELKAAGVATSQRGRRGGYALRRPPNEITVGQIVRLTGGSWHLVECRVCGITEQCPFYGNCVFLGMWERAETAIAEVLDTTTFQDLVDQERATAAKAGWRPGRPARILSPRTPSTTGRPATTYWQKRWRPPTLRLWPAQLARC